MRPHAQKKTNRQTEGQSDRESVTAGSHIAALMSHLNFDRRRVGRGVEAGGEKRGGGDNNM